MDNNLNVCAADFVECKTLHVKTYQKGRIGVIWFGFFLAEKYIFLIFSTEKKQCKDFRGPTLINHKQTN